MKDNHTVRLDVKEAASYLGLPLPFFKNQLKHGTGPNFVAPSERVKFFTQADLDSWRATWRVSSNRSVSA